MKKVLTAFSSLALCSTFTYHRRESMQLGVSSPHHRFGGRPDSYDTTASKNPFS